MKYVVLVIMSFISFLLAASVSIHVDAAYEQAVYPAAWWAPVDRSSAPEWEILPQDAVSGEVILSKRTELGILSNFAATPFVLDGKTYASVEGFWQMLKYPENDKDERYSYPGVVWAFTRDQVAQMTAFEAKNAGKLASENMKKMGIDWVTYRGKKLLYYERAEGEFYNLIERAERAKLEQNEHVKEILIRTGDLLLRPDHVQEPNAPPAWRYHEIWMKLRSQLP